MPDWLHVLLPQYAAEQWMLAVAMMVNVACGLIGCYLVLRRMSLMGDAISHAVLPGLVLAFLFTGSLNIAGMLLGAFAIGLLTTFLTQALHRQGGVPADASMGVVFTSLFALGVVLLRRYAGNVDLDPDCVLQGQLAILPEFEILGRYDSACGGFDRRGAAFGHCIHRAVVEGAQDQLVRSGAGGDDGICARTLSTTC